MGIDVKVGRGVRVDVGVLATFVAATEVSKLTASTSVVSGCDISGAGAFTHDVNVNIDTITKSNSFFLIIMCFIIHSLKSYHEH